MDHQSKNTMEHDIIPVDQAPRKPFDIYQILLNHYICVLTFGILFLFLRYRYWPWVNLNRRWANAQQETIRNTFLRSNSNSHGGSLPSNAVSRAGSVDTLVEGIGQVDLAESDWRPQIDDDCQTEYSNNNPYLTPDRNENPKRLAGSVPVTPSRQSTPYQSPPLTRFETGGQQSRTIRAFSPIRRSNTPLERDYIRVCVCGRMHSNPEDRHMPCAPSLEERELLAEDRERARLLRR
jgi:hypothetical protein